MSSYKPKDLKTKTSDELKEKLKLLRKEQTNKREVELLPCPNVISRQCQ